MEKFIAFLFKFFFVFLFYFAKKLTKIFFKKLYFGLLLLGDLYSLLLFFYINFYYIMFFVSFCRNLFIIRLLSRLRIDPNRLGRKIPFDHSHVCQMSHYHWMDLGGINLHWICKDEKREHNLSQCEICL